MGKHAMKSKSQSTDGGLLAPVMAGASAGAGGIDWARRQAIGSGPWSQGLAVLSGGMTAMTHDPATSGGLGFAERLGVGLADGAWAWAGGPAAIVDSVTGGNGSGLMKAGVSGVLAAGDAVLSGDTRGLGKMTDKLHDGDYGRAAKVIAGAGDAAGEALHETIADDYYLSWDARRIVRDGERELERRGQR